jgi:hypothetical protein
MNTKLSYDEENEPYIAEDYDPDDNGIFKFYVTNSKGSLLPTTGGMGLYVIYGAAAVLVLGAILLQVTKKRNKEA